MDWLPASWAAYLLCRRLPRHVFVELTNNCNLACPLCLQPDHPRSRGNLTLARFRPLADEARHYAKGLILHLLGESLLNPELFAIVAYAEEAALACTFTTNGEYLDEHIEEIFTSGLTAVTVCLDGADAATHNLYRQGSDFERVRCAVETLCLERAARGLTKPHVTVQTLTMGTNAPQREALAEWTKAIGADRYLPRPLHLGLGKVKGEPQELARQFLAGPRPSKAEEEAAVGLCPSTRVCGELYRQQSYGMETWSPVGAAPGTGKAPSATYSPMGACGRFGVLPPTAPLCAST